MSTTEGFNALVASIYDTALEPNQWDAVLPSIRQFVGGQSCGIFSKNPVDHSGSTQYYCGADPFYIELYARTHAKFDPLGTLPPLGQVVSIPDLVSYDEYRGGRFYQEWLRPQGSVDAANVLLQRQGPDFAILFTVLPGRTGMVDEAMRHRIALMVPHLRRALLIGQAIDRHHADAATFADTLDGVNAGLFLVDAGGHIVHANAAGADMALANDVVRSVGGRLVTRDAKVNQCLREVFSAAGAAVAIGAKAIALPLETRDGERYFAHVLPLTAGSRRAAAKAYRAVAAVFIRKATLELRYPLDLIGRAFALTATELKVLRAIIAVGGAPETAKALGVAETTVKTHLRNIFAKTGTNRQAELVQLVGSFSTPLLH